MARSDSVRPPGGSPLLVNVVAVAALCALVVVQALIDRREVLRSAHEEVTNLGEVLAEHTRQTLATLDLGLSTLASEVGERGGLNDVSPYTLHELLRERQAASPATHAFFVLDKDGWLTGTPARAAKASVSFSDTPNYLHHLEKPDSGLFISPAVRGRLGNVADRWIVAVSMRLDGPDGRFAGVVGALLSLDHLLTFYDALRIGDDGVVALLAGDGTLITQSPLAESLIGQPLLEAAQLQRVLTGGSGPFSARFPADGVRRIAGYRTVADRQVLMLVALGEDEVLAPWRKRLSFNATIAVAVIALFLLTTSLFARHIARRRSWEEERARRLGHLAEASAGLARARSEGELIERVAALARAQVKAGLAVVHLGCGDTPIRQASATDPDSPVPTETPATAHRLDELCRPAREDNTVVCLGQAELEAHVGAPVHGLLVVPIVGAERRNLGQIRLSDRYTGDFSEVDVAEIRQLANFTAIALENLRSAQRREEALAEIETIFNSISDGVAAVDLDWCFTYLNAEAERLLQRSRQELLGRNMWEAFPGGSESPAFEVYRRARAENRMMSAEFFYEPLGVWFAIRAYPHAQGLTIYFQNITQRIETEEKLRQSQKMDAIGKLTGGVAHDFNNLLTVILGNADAVMDLPDAMVPPPVRKQVGLIRVAGERAAELTHRLLAFARRQPLDPMETDINELLRGFDDLLQRTLGSGIEIRLHCAPALWSAVVDRHELQNAILNLAINARDAMPTGGLLTIASDNVVLGESEAAQLDLAPGDYVAVSVEDTGEGMSEEVAARAFEPFFTTKPEGKGSGLGLSMVYGFARQSGGQARIDSTPGTGSRISIYLPRAAGAADETPADSGPPAYRGGGERILLVEDDDLVREHTVSCLQRLGYIVTACADGAGALACLEEGCNPDLLLTDVKLAGGMGGRDVAEQARQRCPQLKVLYVSGYTENAFEHDGRVEQGICLLGKPFRIEELALRLRELLDH